MLTCTLLTFALCAAPNATAAVTVGDLTVPIVWSRRAVRSCGDIARQSIVEGGLTRLETRITSQVEQTDASRYQGHLVASFASVRIELIAFSWDRMSHTDVELLRSGYRASLWHELGHVRTAQASVDAVNADGDFSASTAAEYKALAKLRADAAAARINADQEAYDRAVDHGLRQDALPPPLGGPDTIVACPGR